MLTKDEARRIAVNIAKLPEVLASGSGYDFCLKPFLIELPYRVVVTYTLAGNPMTTINPPAGVTPELILIGFVATFLTVATVWVLWYAAEKVLPPDEVGQLQFS